MKRTVSEKRNSRLSPSWTKSTPKKRRRCVTQYALCITDAEPDLQPRKVYKILPDRIASKGNYLRVIDESGEDYLYPDRSFVLIKLPQKAEIAFAAAT
jgi:hypothetical protein